VILNLLDEWQQATQEDKVFTIGYVNPQLQVAYLSHFHLKGYRKNDSPLGQVLQNKLSVFSRY
jgi:hypothetical protein